MNFIKIKKVIYITFIITTIQLTFSFPGITKELDYNIQRWNMVKYQIEERGITDKNVLKAMKKVKRHLFVPKEYESLAYTDSPLPIKVNQTISQPYIVALMTELLHLQGTEKVLEIGTNSGYQAAILSEIAKDVYTIEIIKELAISSYSLLKRLGYKNIKTRYGDGYLGWKEAAPFDKIIVTAACS